MLISLKCDYAIRALMELGSNKDNIPIQKKVDLREPKLRMKGVKKKK